MTTEELIAQLATHVSTGPTQHLRTRVGRVLLLPVLLSVMWMLVMWGINPALPTFARSTAFWIKEIWIAAVILSVWPLVLRLARPGVSTGRYPKSLLATWAVMATLGVWQLSIAATGDTSSAWLGSSWQVCSVSIMALALPLLAALLWVLRDMAPTRPGLCGLVAGLLSGSLAALIYSLHCPETAFAFLSIWYTAGMLGVGVLGGVIGRQWLRW
jgi:hypothetical protein